MKFKIYFKDLKNLLPLLIKIYLLFLGCGWIIFHIYLRFILERSSYEFIELKANITFLHYFLVFGFILLHLLIIVSNMYFLYKKNILYSKKSIFYKITLWFTMLLDSVYWKPLEYIHDKVAPHIPGSGRFFLYLETKWQTIGFTYLIIFFFNIFPKILIAITFVIEAVILGRIEIFLQVLPLILIPILFTILLKFFLSFAIRNKPNFTDSYESINFLNPIYDKEGRIEKYTKYKFIVKDEYLGQVDTKEDLRCLLILDHIQNIVIYTKDLLSIITPYVTIFTSLLYLSGGIYRIIILLF